ncbi:MAG: biotin--[Oscillospiraceae bacterium]|nr:biotin--[acetyl-CoA-carboxylase] ligase [Oscillospiraceae bacterium]
MRIRDAVLAELLLKREQYLSGEELAALLSVSRSAVWKAIGQLRSEGYAIEAGTNRGYRLIGGDVLSREGVSRFLTTPDIDVHVYSSVGSTNTLLKAWAEDGCAEGTVAAAEEQTSGRGRRGRSFFSPRGTGLYLSILLRPESNAGAALGITTAAAVAAAEAIEALSGEPTQIKWVNDIYLRGKKVCGILTEASLDVESGGLRYAIVGIGINVLQPAGGFPNELRAVAGSIFKDSALPDLRNRLAASLIDRFFVHFRQLGDEECYEAYRRRCSVLGRRVTVLSGGVAVAEGEVLDLERDYSLRIRYDDGTESLLSSGEVSVLA